MSELLEDDIIQDFLFDYSRLEQSQSGYQEAQNVIYQRLPDYIRQFRKLAHRMTQEELAVALEVDHSYISKIEHSHQQPSNDFLGKFNDFVKSWGNDD